MYRYLDSLDLEFDVPMLYPAVESRVSVDVVDGGDVMGDQGQYLLSGLLRVVM